MKYKPQNKADIETIKARLKEYEEYCSTDAIRLQVHKIKKQLERLENERTK